MHDDDSVATALEDVKKGDAATVHDKTNRPQSTIESLENIPHGNKIALRDIAAGEKVIKYGAVIGESTEPIAKGRLVHVHNVKSLKLDVPSAIKREIIRQMGIECPGGNSDA